MAKLLRWMLIALLLLRVAAGSAWALPSTPGQPQAAQEIAVTLPCHAAADAPASTANGMDGHVHANASLHGHGAHCALCFPAVATPLTVVLAPVRHAQPASVEPAGVHWVRAPELRPPI